jgi:hypothetical protein
MSVSTTHNLAHTNTAAHDFTVTVHGNNDTAVCRNFSFGCLNDMLTVISQLTRHFRDRKLATACAYVVVQPISTKRVAEDHDLLEEGDIEIINICGRVTHSYTSTSVVRRACQPLITKSRDSFGMRSGIFTTLGNFVTSESNKTTLFRGAKRCTDVMMIADHIFEPDSIHSIVMHMLVAKARLPHPVVVDAKQFEIALLESTQWDVSHAIVSEDMCYMKPLHLKFHDGYTTKLLLHIYSSGIVFFFVTCPATPLSLESEARVVAQCGEVYACLAAVC